MQSLQRRCPHVVLVLRDLYRQAIALKLQARCPRHWPCQDNASRWLAVLTQMKTSLTVGYNVVVRKAGGYNVVVIKTGGLGAVVLSGGYWASTPAALSAWEEPIPEGYSGILEGCSGFIKEVESGILAGGGSGGSGGRWRAQRRGRSRAGEGEGAGAAQIPLRQPGHVRSTGRLSVGQKVLQRGRRQGAFGKLKGAGTWEAPGGVR